MMSQTETLLLFVLGFSVALFVVLLLGRGLWAMMGGWSAWRDARKVPAAIMELQAERDGLKAEKAMLAQKLEASLNDMKMRMAEQMAEVSRNRNRMLDMGQTLKERESTIAHLQAQLDDKLAQAASLSSQIEDNVKSINLAYAKMAKREEDHLQMQNLLKEAQATLLLRDEKIRNQQDETKALRELLAGAQGAVAQPRKLPLTFDNDATPNVMGSTLPVLNDDAPLSRFDSERPTFNPLLETSAFAEPQLDRDTGNDGLHENADMVERSVSNVLSLAERVRSLQTGMKKA